MMSTNRSFARPFRVGVFLLLLAGSQAALPRVSAAATIVDDIREAALFTLAGQRYYRDRQYAQALGAFEKAYKLSLNPRLFQYIGQTHRQLGEYVIAADFLERCLAEDQSLTESERAELRAIIGESRSKAELERTPRRPVWRLTVGAAVAAAGVVLLSFGAAILSTDGQPALPPPRDDPAYRGDGMNYTVIHARQPGASLLAVGLGGLAAGILYAELPGRRGTSKPRPSIAVAASASGLLVSLRGTFP